MNTPTEPDQPQTAPDSAAILPAGILNRIDASVQTPIPWVIEKLLAEGEQMLIFGPPKVGKSQFALQLAMSVALGKPFLKWEVKEPKRVLYLNLEMGTRFFMLRVGRHYLHAHYPKDTWSEVFPDPEFSEEVEWLLADIDACPSSALLEQINRGIEGQLFFTDGLREVDFSKQSADAEACIAHWQSIVDALKPDLIVFDTLAKTHSANESDNREIKDVLLKLRKVATVSTNSGEANATDPERAGERKELAHVIIHHARKLPEHGTETYISLDNIRGGSAIRAEADLIFGIFGAVSNRTKDDENSAKELNRTITIESRNQESLLMDAAFDGWVFSLKNSTRPVDQIPDEQWMVHIKRIFLGEGVRGLSKKTLLDRLVEAGDEKIGRRQIEETIKRLAKDNASEFHVLRKAGSEELLSKFPYERLGGKELYWIRDRSPWLEEPALQERFASHTPTPVRKSPTR